MRAILTIESDDSNKSENMPTVLRHADLAILIDCIDRHGLRDDNPLIIWAKEIKGVLMGGQPPNESYAPPESEPAAEAPATGAPTRYISGPSD